MISSILDIATSQTSIVKMKRPFHLYLTIMDILIINGPNLNKLGVREPDIYGSETMYDVARKIIQETGVDLEVWQSNHEGDIIDKIWSSYQKKIIINAGGFSHYSVAIRDAISGSGKDFIEVHISDVENREDFRKTLILKDVCIDFISGEGVDGYQIAVDKFIKKA